MHKILANTLFLGKDLIYLPQCHSTNDVALQKYKNKEVAEGSIIITDQQTAGRGQRGNVWESEPHQNLTFSLVLTPRFLDAREQFGLNLAIAVGIKEALDAYCSGIMVKWPNDIVHNKEGKIGGILIENTISHKGLEVSIVGIGLNINQTIFSHPAATSLARLSGTAFNREKIFEAVVSSIEHFYTLLKNGQTKLLRERYLSQLFRFGELCEYDDGEKFRGKITGITDEGKLVIQKESGHIHQYAFKEVRFE